MIDEKAFETAFRATHGRFATDHLYAKTVIEAYEAAKAEPAERPMRERVDAAIVAAHNLQQPVFDTILTELATPTRGMIEAMETRMSQAPHRDRMVIDYIEAWRAALLAAREGK